jgi:hypothetical protein
MPIVYGILAREDDAGSGKRVDAECDALHAHIALKTNG